MTGSNYDVKDLSLADTGKLRAEWAAAEMPVLRLVRERFATAKPLTGTRISGCLHITSETANLALTLKAGGAEVALCASNPLSTQDDIAAFLVKYHDIPVYAIRGEDRDTYYQHVMSALAHEPHITMDDGGDLVSTMHKERTDLIPNVIGGTEETTTGVIRFRSMAASGALKYPVIAVNDTPTKHFFDNRYGTGQSTLDGIMRATNILLAGKNFVVGGYGWCGRGIATRARGMGANVIVTEVSPLRALEAVMDGFRVMPMAEAARVGEIFVTAAGDVSVIDVHHLLEMRDGVILANSGHFDVEVNVAALEELATGKRSIRPLVVEYTLPNGHHVYLLGEGRLINLAAAEGHPAAVMDMSFSDQALTAEYLVMHGKALDNAVHSVPEEIDNQVASLKLRAMGISIDTLTEEQEAYLATWEEGT
jgi:adenosylhomocysteinase